MSHSRTPLLMKCGKTFVDICLDKPAASAPKSLPYARSVTGRKTEKSAHVAEIVEHHVSMIICTAIQVES
ncbi:hypothetical protein T05_9223 [Trichinella murrelli]|uniref:Uncharacterized protein n=1 Tax=Trichinella murrelli TaxID=144512 RepID=A0A0V0T5W0_9BILA|nr:hypothetical protein T05_7975 [Trichinella murrelli]KRX34277.1 hypothetical protein T05_10525 [Trichinella murrelli]KRX35209.1 hypothetical protein T05_9223 [Trichinella murrelli]